MLCTIALIKLFILQLTFDGVKVKDFEVDKLVTYFDNFEFEVTNAVPVKELKEYEDLRYYARQFRLNHKPYNYKLTVNSDDSKEALVRVYIGPKYDSEERELHIEQSRLAFVEIDRFPVKCKRFIHDMKNHIVMF